MEQEIQNLQKQVNDLKSKLDYFTYPDRFQFDRTVLHRGRKLGFYSLTPIAQPSSTGTTLNMTVVGGAAVTEANGFSGNLGTKFYTIGDIVLHLKALGLLAKT